MDLIVGKRFKITSKSKTIKEQYQDQIFEIVEIKKNSITLKKLDYSNNPDKLLALDAYNRFCFKNKYKDISDFNYEKLFEVDFNWFTPETKRIFREVKNV